MTAIIHYWPLRYLAGPKAHPAFTTPSGRLGPCRGILPEGGVLDKLLENVECNLDAGMPRVAQVIATPDVFDINVVVVAPAGWPWLIESEPIAAVLEAVVPVDHLGTDHAERMVMTEMGTVTVVRNATIMVAIVAVVAMVVGYGAWLPLALHLLGPLLLPRLLLPLLLLFLLFLGFLRPLLFLLFLVLLLLVLLLPLPLGIGRRAHSHQPCRAEDSRHQHPVQDTDFHATPPW